MLNGHKGLENLFFTALYQGLTHSKVWLFVSNASQGDSKDLTLEHKEHVRESPGLFGRFR
ncbi:MAG: hypothetical protein LBV23_07120 [Deltaproteobacteria bacterium]|jgi:hypothetical protein|nr:hypothetical protein [Deltaproteobacteria bacterium]